MGLRVHHLVSPGAGAITLIAWAGALGLSVSSCPFGKTSTDSLGDRHGVRATPYQSPAAVVTASTIRGTTAASETSASWIISRPVSHHVGLAGPARDRSPASTPP